MIVKNKTKKIVNNGIVRGFLPDFSRYLFKDYPIDDAYNNPDLIKKLQGVISGLLTMRNPMYELQDKGYCRKFEKMNPKQDKAYCLFAHLCELSS